MAAFLNPGDRVALTEDYIRTFVHTKCKPNREANAVLEDHPMTDMEKRLTANSLAQAAIFSALLDLLVQKKIISSEESKELMQEAALTFMKPNIIDVERMAGAAILSLIRNK